MATAAGKAATFALRRGLHRDASQMPGAIALKLDPQLVSELASKLSVGSVVVVGTNGKTSVNNLVADGLEAAGHTVICNRRGANMKPGVATTLIQSEPAEWGVFESDELWLAKTLPDLDARFVLLLNLFRDQLDRCGEIARIQDSIAGALRESPATTLIYNADDPQCAQIAANISNKTIAFGIDEDLELPQNTVADAAMCQLCDGMLTYDYRQYGQLGVYRCEQCGFQRPTLDYKASGVVFSADGTRFTVERCATGETWELSTDQPLPYLVYNLLATSALLAELGVAPAIQQRAIDAFDPHNGRLQAYELGGRRLLLNLAKNPTGFNQNLKIVETDRGPKAVAFFINDKTADGHDISWIWDIDFEELAGHDSMIVFAGGTRANDVQVRLKYAGIRSTIVDSVDEALAQSGALPFYAIANYTALPPVKAALDRLAETGEMPVQRALAPEANAVKSASDADVRAVESAQKPTVNAVKSASDEGEDGAKRASESGENAVKSALGNGSDDAPLVIVHMLPDLLNLYGDGGNVRILEQRLRWRNIPVRIERVRYGDPIDLAEADLVFLGGGPDREQKLASEVLMDLRDDLRKFVESDGVLLAICGGYQILGRQWLLGDDLVEGLALIGLETRRPGTSADRLIDNLVLRSPLAEMPVVGYENHAGRTYLDPGVEPFGQVISSCGHGNNDDDATDGVRFRNVIGTYSHGPLLSKNPEIADELLSRALERKAVRMGRASDADSAARESASDEDVLSDARASDPNVSQSARASDGNSSPYLPLLPLDDSVERAANNVMLKRLGVA